MNIEIKPKHFLITGVAMVGLGYGASEYLHSLIHNSIAIKFAEDFQFTWQVQISAASDCGGVIVAREWVLTAAHCLKNKEGMIKNADEIKVIAGTREIENKGGVSAKNFVIHKLFDMNTSPMAYDIALVNVTFPEVNTSIVRLATNDQPLPDPMFVAGWNCSPSGNAGIDDLIQFYSKCGNRLGYTDVLPMDQAKCTEKYGEWFVCAGGSYSRNPQWPGFDREDSGGGLVNSTDGKATLIGIANYILTDWETYARVSKYSQWIKDTICAGPAPDQEPNCSVANPPVASSLTGPGVGIRTSALTTSNLQARQ